MNRPEHEDEASLFSLSTEFLEAAEILYRAPPTKLNVSIVTLYLLGHSAELLLKSFLYKCGVPLEELRRTYGHSLSKLVECCHQKGLSHALSIQHIVKLSFVYTPKKLEYRQRQEAQFPPLEEVIQEIRSLQQYVFNHVAEF